MSLGVCMHELGFQGSSLVSPALSAISGLPVSPFAGIWLGEAFAGEFTS